MGPLYWELHQSERSKERVGLASEDREIMPAVLGSTIMEVSSHYFSYILLAKRKYWVQHPFMRKRLFKGRDIRM